MGKGPEQTLLQRGHTDGQQTYEKMLKVTNHQRNANKNHNEIPSHTCHNSYYQYVNKQQVLARLWKKRSPFVLWVGMQTGAPPWKAEWRYLKKLKMDLPFDPAIPLQGIYPKEPQTLI